MAPGVSGHRPVLPTQPETRSVSALVPELLKTPNQLAAAILNRLRAEIRAEERCLHHERVQSPPFLSAL